MHPLSAILPAKSLPAAIVWAALVLGPLALLGPSARAQDGVTVRVLNDTPDNLTVTLVDRNTQPPERVLSEVINGNAAVNVTLTPDASGRGNLSWTAVTTDQDMRRCARRTRRGVNSGATVHVFANRRCSS